MLFHKTKEYRVKMSIACSGKNNGMFGKKQSIKTKEKIRQKALLRGQDKEYCKRLSDSAKISSKKRWDDPVYRIKQSLANKNAKRTYVRTKEHQEKLNKSCKGRTAWNKGYGEYMRGDKNPMYIHGLSITYPAEFNRLLREEIRKRDQYRCQMCFISEKEYPSKLSVHHIDWNKYNNIEWNLVSLCKSCHQFLHSNKLIIDLLENKKNNIYEVADPEDGIGNTNKIVVDDDGFK